MKAAIAAADGSFREAAVTLLRATSVGTQPSLAEPPGRQHRPDLAVVDLRVTPRRSSTGALLLSARADEPQTLVLLDVTTTAPDAGTPEAVSALTNREREVLALVAEGWSNAGIATRLVVSERTVENHIGTMFKKLDFGADEHAVNKRVQAALIWLRASRS